MRGRGISPGDRGWTKAVADCDLLPLSVESEDAANVRVVVDEPLDAAELSEWVGVVRSALRVPDGRLALCGGSVYVLEKARWAEEFVRTVDIPAGDYRATLCCYASAPNGRACVERSGSDEPLGAWFRRTRPGQAMPPWLHNFCVNDPSADPGHGKQWKRAGLKSGGAVVDFLLHLERTDGAPRSAALNDEGVMEAAECRKPDPFPMGLATVNLQGGDEQPVPAAEPVHAVAPAIGGDLVPLAGGPVAVPIAKLVRVAQIAWMCHPYAHPALRITFPGKPRKLGLDAIEDADVAVSGREAQVTFINNSQPADALLPLTQAANQLAALPGGAVIELQTSRLKTKSALGAHRYRGPVQGGAWQIESSFPRVDTAVLAEAVSLAEALESGRRLLARDEAEAIRIEERVRRVLADYFGANSLQRSGAELSLRKRDPALFAHVVARVFWSRYAAIWPLQDADAPAS
jgi:hypothetical protein